MTRKELVWRLDRLVSFYVRNSEKKCFTCGKVIPYYKRQAGHFIPRGVMKTRWLLENVHVQCNHCNVELGGNLEVYKKKRDPKVLEFLQEYTELYNTGQLAAPTEEEMLVMYDYMEQLIKQSNFSHKPPEWLEED